MSRLDLLMVHADDRRPVLESGLATGAGDRADPKDERSDVKFLGDDGADQNDLARQRWAVVVPAGAEGKRLLALIEPLVQARRAAQQGNEVLVYEAPAKMDLAAAADWKKNQYDTGKDTTHDLPRYLLMLGDLDQVPLSLQQVLSAESYVGRLAFPDDGGYQAYVDKLLRWEKQRSAVAQARSLLFTVHDHTAATESGYRSLMTPGVELARKRKDLKQFDASEVLELGDQDIPSPDELLQAVNKPEPAALFTLSHGLGAPRGGWQSTEDQHRRQGAMSFGREGTLTAQELGERVFLPGGVWFMLACYGAGTPDSSAYKPWLEELAKSGQFKGQTQAVLDGLPKDGGRPFIAALPQAVLRNSNGPLAFMGHVDLAWTYSFAELDSGRADPKPGRFMDILRYVLKGDRVGVAFHALMRFFGSVSTELSSLYGRTGGGPPSDAALATKLSHLWMLRQDLAGYILLGDPAAQLPLQTPPPAVVPPSSAAAMPPEQLARLAAKELGHQVRVTVPAAMPDSSSSAAPGSAAAVTPAGAAPEPPPVQLPTTIERLEEALGRLLSGDGSLKEVALDLQTSRSDLQRLLDLYRQGGRRALGIKS